MYNSIKWGRQQRITPSVDYQQKENGMIVAKYLDVAGEELAGRLKTLSGAGESNQIALINLITGANLLYDSLEQEIQADPNLTETQLRELRQLRILFG